MIKTFKPALIVLIVGSFFTVVLLGFVLVGPHPVQCEDNVITQQQIEDSGCIIGADIGTGLIYLSGLAVGALTVFTSAVLSAFALATKMRRQQKVK